MSLHMDPPFCSSSYCWNPFFWTVLRISPNPHILLMLVIFNSCHFPRCSPGDLRKMAATAVRCSWGTSSGSMPRTRPFWRWQMDPPWPLGVVGPKLGPPLLAPKGPNRLMRYGEWEKSKKCFRNYKVLWIMIDKPVFFWVCVQGHGCFSQFQWGETWSSVWCLIWMTECQIQIPDKNIENVTKGARANARENNR